MTEKENEESLIAQIPGPELQYGSPKNPVKGEKYLFPDPAGTVNGAEVKASGCSSDFPNPKIEAYTTKPRVAAVHTAWSWAHCSQDYSGPC